MRGYAVRIEGGGPPSLGALLIRLAANATGLLLAAAIVPGIEIGDWQSLVAGTAILALVNTLVRPVALFVSCCLVVLTFGLFLVVVNAAMLALTAWLSGQLGLNLEVDGFWSAVGGALVISLVSLVATILTRTRRIGR